MQVKKQSAQLVKTRNYPGCGSKPIRWIVDDASNLFNGKPAGDQPTKGSILDPPKFGRGPKGEVWEFFDLIPTLLESCKAILSAEPVFVLLTAYAIKSSALTLHGAMAEMMRGKSGSTRGGRIGYLRKLSKTVDFKFYLCEVGME